MRILEYAQEYEKKISIKVKEIHKDPNSVYNSKSCKEKHSNTIKESQKFLNQKIGDA